MFIEIAEPNQCIWDNAHTQIGIDPVKHGFNIATPKCNLRFLLHIVKKVYGDIRVIVFCVQDNEGLIQTVTE